MFISIIIPTFNRCVLLDKTIASISSQNKHLTNFEIIVVDNGSTDDTKIICEKYSNEHFKLSYFYDAMPGLLTGRHKGATEAKGDIFVFTDDDIEVSASWLDTIIKVMSEREDIAFLTGPNFPLYETYPPKWVEYFWTSTEYGGTICTWLSLMDLGDKELEISPLYVFGLNFCIRKTAFDQVDGFNPDNIPAKYQMLQGDGETGLSIKAERLKLKALYSPGAMVYHQVLTSRMTYDYFDKRAFYQGVCNSFSEIRMKEGIDDRFNTSEEESCEKEISFLTKIQIRIRLIFRSLTPKEKTKTEDQSNIPAEIIELKNRLALQEKNGYEFHQHHYNTDPIVKEWCHQKNYLNYKLPI